MKSIYLALLISAMTVHVPSQTRMLIHKNDGTIIYQVLSSLDSLTFDTLMVEVPGGTFQMGSNDSTYEQPIHSVTLSDFFIDRYEVTFEKWTAVRNWALSHGYSDLPVGSNGYGGTTNHPVTELCWYDEVKWCNARSEMDGLTPVYYTDETHATVYRTGTIDLSDQAVHWSGNGYRLPTEAEWEYAAGGGQLTHGYTYSGSNDIDAVAWYINNSGNHTHPVGTAMANELGLFNFSGTVWEYCWDWSSSYSSASVTDPHGPTSGTMRVLRGGSFFAPSRGVRVTVRGSYTPNGKEIYGGFRCVQML